MGFNFNNETIIQFGQYDEPTTLISETEVTTIVKPSLFAPAVVPIRVHNKELYSTSVNFTFTSAQEGFGAQRR
jgi:hypothetical protein